MSADVGSKVSGLNPGLVGAVQPGAASGFWVRDLGSRGGTV